MKKYDVIFIGSGHACWHGALILNLPQGRAFFLCIFLNNIVKCLYESYYCDNYCDAYFGRCCRQY